LETREPDYIAQAIVDLVARSIVLPAYARRLDDLEQQSRRYRHRACRDGRDHAIFRREHLRDLQANVAGASECKIDNAPDRTEGNRRRMKTAAIETISDAGGALAVRNRAATDFAQLVKARLTSLVLLTTAVGYYLGVENPISYFGLFHVVFGTALAAASAAALNQWWEWRSDALMHRTKTRPIPAGRMRARDALLIGTLLAIAGIIYLALACNVLTASLAALTIILYVFAYTPLKRISTTNTLVGAIPGAIPPMIGWGAARGTLDAGAWSLLAILFFWQMPHFFALAWMYREDYARAGFRMMSTGDETGARSSSQSVLFCMLLLIVGAVPAYLGLTNAIYVPIAFALGGLFIAVAMQFHRRRTARSARALFIASIVYLPLLLGALVLTKI
jgi:protoheme IX farnesyltransferase